MQGSALLLARGDRPVRNERDARVSIHHCAACALLLGAAGVPEFSDATVFRPDIVALRRKVRAALDASLPDGAARVTIQLISGEKLSETVMAAKGSLGDPLSDRDIEAKLRDCARLGWNRLGYRTHDRRCLASRYACGCLGPDDAARLSRTTLKTQYSNHGRNQ